MTRKLFTVVLLLLPLLSLAGQRVWLEEKGRYFDPANPLHRKSVYLDLPLPAVEGGYRIAAYYGNGQPALEGLSQTPEFDRRQLLGDVVEYYPDGTVSVRATYVVRGQVCDCGNSYTVLHGPYSEYHPNGQLHREVTYYGGGLTDGDYTEYDPEGRVTRTYSMQNYRRTGRYAEYSQGQLITEANYVDGVQEGPYRELDEQGRPVELLNYVDGQYHGLARFYRDGMLVREENFRNGDRVGPQKSFYADGTLQRIYTASRFRGAPEGEDLSYRQDGTLSRKVVRILDDQGKAIETKDQRFNEEGQLTALEHSVGKWQLEEQYNKEGVLTLRRERNEKGLQGLLVVSQWSRTVREHYRDGERHGRSVEEGSDNSRVEGSYNQGRQEGLWVTTERDGSREVARFSNGELHGRSERFDAEGNSTGFVTWRNGQKHGPANYINAMGSRMITGYYEDEFDGDYLETQADGRIVHQGRYQRGTPDGVHYQFTDVGQLWKKESYRNGVAHGDWIETGYDGQSMVRKTYQEGTLVSEVSVSLGEPAASGIQ